MASVSETFLQFLHVICACVLVGSTVFVGFVLMPTLRKAMGNEERMAFLRQMAFRAKIVTWSAIAILFAVGFYRIVGMINFIWAGGYGTLLSVKIALALLFLALAAFHDFFLGAKVVNMNPSDPQFMTLRRIVIAFSQIQLVCLLIIVFISCNLRLYTW